jgi:hypothetical protein
MSSLVKRQDYHLHSKHEHYLLTVKMMVILKLFHWNDVQGYTLKFDLNLRRSMAQLCKSRNQDGLGCQVKILNSVVIVSPTKSNSRAYGLSPP